MQSSATCDFGPSSAVAGGNVHESLGQYRGCDELCFVEAEDNKCVHMLLDNLFKFYLNLENEAEATYRQCTKPSVLVFGRG
jgi:hypothetical protein